MFRIHVEAKILQSLTEENSTKKSFFYQQLIWALFQKKIKLFQILSPYSSVSQKFYLTGATVQMIFVHIVF